MNSTPLQYSHGIVYMLQSLASNTIEPKFGTKKLLELPTLRCKYEFLKACNGFMKR